MSWVKVSGNPQCAGHRKQGSAVGALLFSEPLVKGMKQDFHLPPSEPCKRNLNPVWQPGSAQPYLPQHVSAECSRNQSAQASMAVSED